MNLEPPCHIDPSQNDVSYPEKKKVTMAPTWYDYTGYKLKPSPPELLPVHSGPVIKVANITCIFG